MDSLVIILSFNIICLLLGGFYVNSRINTQDKYISTYIQSFANYKDFPKPPSLNTTEILLDKEIKPQVLSPRYDAETVMQGKVVDLFD